MPMPAAQLRTVRTTHSHTCLLLDTERNGRRSTLSLSCMIPDKPFSACNPKPACDPSYASPLCTFYPVPLLLYARYAL